MSIMEMDSCTGSTRIIFCSFYLSTTYYWLEGNMKESIECLLPPTSVQNQNLKACLNQTKQEAVHIGKV